MDIKLFILGGKSIFTLYSNKIDKRYTYKVQRDKKNSQRYFVKLMWGSDNETDYRFLGWFYNTGSNAYVLMWSGNSCTKPDQLNYRMMQQFLNIVGDVRQLPETCEFYPSGKCARCGRLLTTPESIKQGFGPECVKFMYEAVS